MLCDSFSHHGHEENNRLQYPVRRACSAMLCYGAWWSSSAVSPIAFVQPLKRPAGLKGGKDEVHAVPPIIEDMAFGKYLPLLHHNPAAPQAQLNMSMERPLPALTFSTSLHSRPLLWSFPSFIALSSSCLSLSLLCR